MAFDTKDTVEFDDLVALALARSADQGVDPPASLRARVLSKLDHVPPPVPPGFSFRYAEQVQDWVPHPVPGIRMKVLGMNRERGYATLLLDVAPGARFPAHRHTGDEECFVVSGSLYTCGRRLGPGDFVHADNGTDHGELYTEEGVQVILVVPPEDYMPDAPW